MKTYTEIFNPATAPQPRASADYARGIAHAEFGRRFYHPKQWHGFIDRRPGHIGKLNSHDLKLVMDRNERLRRALVAA